MYNAVNHVSPINVNSGSTIKKKINCSVKKEMLTGTSRSLQFMVSRLKPDWFHACTIFSVILDGDEHWHLRKWWINKLVINMKHKTINNKVNISLRVNCEVIQIVVHVEREHLPQLEEFLQGLINENDADESCKGFLCESCYIAH